MILREGWWSQSDHAEVDLAQPRIYEWRLDEVGVYIGESCRLRKRILEYPNNVRKLSIGAPYRKGAPLGFRDLAFVACKASTHRNAFQAAPTPKPDRAARLCNGARPVSTELARITRAMQANATRLA